ncbi:MAG: ribosome maturation factor RimP [Thermotogae bacterium]|nr:ribosome maturation factor RimP [Thermotogota bacterium]
MNDEKDREIERRAEELAEKLAEEMNFTLVDVEWKGGQRGMLKVFLDKEGGITIRDVERFSRAYSDMLDAEDFVDRSYVLEVSSPGLDRKLSKPRELNWAIGKRVILVLKDGRTYRGVLDYYNEDENTVGVSGNFFKLDEVALLRLDEF